MKLENISDKIKEIFLSTFPNMKEKSFSFKKKQSDFENWDSFAHMELVAKIEQEFDINLEFSEIAEIDTPQKFVDVVKKKKS